MPGVWQKLFGINFAEQFDKAGDIAINGVVHLYHLLAHELRSDRAKAREAQAWVEAQGCWYTHAPTQRLWECKRALNRLASLKRRHQQAGTPGPAADTGAPCPAEAQGHVQPAACA